MAAHRRRRAPEIEDDIARTRLGLSLTLDALAVELAPKHFVEKAADMITRSLSANEPGGIALGGGVRADPVPLALIGLGIAWLVAENTGLLDGIVPGRGDRAAGLHTAAGDDVETAAAAPAERIVGRTGAPVIDAGQAGSGSSWVHQATGAARGALRSIRAGGGEALERAGELIEEAAHSGERARRAGGRLIEDIEHNPLLLGLAGIACGTLLAMLLPSSRRERELVGRAREDLWQQAEKLGHCAADGIRAIGRTPAGTAAES